MELSYAHPKALEIILKIMQTVSWLGGLWGLFMLCGMVGSTLDSTQVNNNPSFYTDFQILTVPYLTILPP